MEGEGTPYHHHSQIWTLTRSCLPQHPIPRCSYNPMLHPGHRHRPSHAPFPTQLLSELHVFIVSLLSLAALLHLGHGPCGALQGRLSGDTRLLLAEGSPRGSQFKGTCLRRWREDLRLGSCGPWEAGRPMESHSLSQGWRWKLSLGSLRSWWEGGGLDYQPRRGMAVSQWSLSEAP